LTDTNSYRYKISVPLSERNIFQDSGLQEIKSFVKRNNLSFTNFTEGSKYICKLTILKNKLTFTSTIPSGDEHNSFYDWVKCFIFAANLAIPGIINTYEKIPLYINGKIVFLYPAYENELSECLYEGNANASQRLLSLLDIKCVWNWIIRQRGVCDGNVSDTNVSRSVVAYTNLFPTSNEYFYPGYFIWSILGLEALYAKGNGNILNQIKEKLNVVLQLTDKETKMVSSLYDMRSRFFHGDFNLASQLFTEHWNKTLIDIEYETLEKMRFGIRLFIASLQFCAKNNLTELNFQYQQTP